MTIRVTLKDGTQHDVWYSRGLSGSYGLSCAEDGGHDPNSSNVGARKVKLITFFERDFESHAVWSHYLDAARADNPKAADELDRFVRPSSPRSA